MDADMLFVSDVCELENSISDDIAVSVVKSLAKFEQTSFMLFNCEHASHKLLTPEFVEEAQMDLLGLEWLKEDEVGALDPKWNQLVGYQSIDTASGNLHYTMGIPAFAETSTSEGAQQWHDTAKRATSAIPWVEIMGHSVHAVNINGVTLPKYVWDFDKNQPKPQHLELVRTLVLKHRESKVSS